MKLHIVIGTLLVYTNMYSATPVGGNANSNTVDPTRQQSVSTSTAITGIKPSRHHRGPSITSAATHAREPRENDVNDEDLERGVVRSNTVDLRPSTGINSRFNSRWKTELLAWQNEFLAMTTFMAIALGGIHEANSRLENALAFGISVTVAAVLFGGAWMNPAVALAQSILGEISPFRAVSMITAELTAAIAASGLIYGLTGEIRGLVTLTDGISVTQGFFIETIITFTLVYLVILLTHENNSIGHLAPLTVGSALTALELFSIPLTSGSANLARAFGPSVIAGKFQSYEWLYYVSNIAGAVAAATYYKFVRAVQTSPIKEPLYGPSLALPVRRTTEAQEETHN